MFAHTFIVVDGGGVDFVGFLVWLPHTLKAVLLFSQHFLKLATAIMIVIISVYDCYWDFYHILKCWIILIHFFFCSRWNGEMPLVRNRTIFSIIMGLHRQCTNAFFFLLPLKHFSLPCYSLIHLCKMQRSSLWGFCPKIETKN